jgi:hypothetical protein
MLMARHHAGKIWMDVDTYLLFLQGQIATKLTGEGYNDA